MRARLARWLRRAADWLAPENVRVPSLAEGLGALRARELDRAEADAIIQLVNSRVRR